MGYFTWTDATCKSPRRNKDWGYNKKDIIGYDGYCKVVCPDDSVIEEPSYFGYGVFGGRDIYDLVVDWNKEDLSEIMTRKLGKKFWDGQTFGRIVKKYVNGASDEEVTEYVKQLSDAGDCAPYLIKDWKRNIGIMIACEDEDNKLLRYPIKITKNRKDWKYNDLYPSWSTQ